MAIVVNKPLPEFEANATGGIKVSNTSHLGQILVLYFYPKDNTPGCTVEGQQFRDLHDRFTAENTVVFGVSRDSLRSHDNFRAKHGFPFHLIADDNEALCALFDVIKLKKLYGKESLGVERSTFLIDADGVLCREWRKVKVDGHAQIVLSAIEAMSPTT